MWLPCIDSALFDCLISHTDIFYYVLFDYVCMEGGDPASFHVAL